MKTDFKYQSLIWEKVPKQQNDVSFMDVMMPVYEPRDLTSSSESDLQLDGVCRQITHLADGMGPKLQWSLSDYIAAV